MCLLRSTILVKKTLFTKSLERSKHILKCYVFKCVLCSVLINVHELVLKMNYNTILVLNINIVSYKVFYSILG